MKFLTVLIGLILVSTLFLAACSQRKTDTAAEPKPSEISPEQKPAELPEFQEQDIDVISEEDVDLGELI